MMIIHWRFPRLIRVSFSMLHSLYTHTQDVWVSDWLDNTQVRIPNQPNQNPISELWNGGIWWANPNQENDTSHDDWCVRLCVISLQRVVAAHPTYHNHKVKNEPTRRHKKTNPADVQHHPQRVADTKKGHIRAEWLCCRSLARHHVGWRPFSYS